MASAFHDHGLTLAPFQRVYGQFREISMLADRLFPVPERNLDSAPAANAEALVPEVITLPNRARFEAAVARWKTDISFDSFAADMKEHESFREIIEQGYAVVPLIAAELRRQPSFLFLALEEIFGEDPVPEAAYGNVKTVAAEWLKWLQQ
jgi:hypothetical protein